MRAARPPDTSRLRFPIDAVHTPPRLITRVIHGDEVESKFDKALREMIEAALPKTPAERGSPTKSLRVKVGFAYQEHPIILYASDMEFDDDDDMEFGLESDMEFDDDDDMEFGLESDMEFDAHNTFRNMLVETDDPAQGRLRRGRLDVEGAVEAVRQSLDACRVSPYENNDVVLEYVEHNFTYYNDTK